MNSADFIDLCQHLSPTHISPESPTPEHRDTHPSVGPERASIWLDQARTNRVRLIPDLSAAALRIKQSKQLALWYALRAINVTGSGIVDKDIALTVLRDTYHYSTASLYDCLRKGEGIYWKVLCDRISIRGLRDVAAALDIGRINDRHFREITPGQFNTSLARKAQVYASIHHPAGIHGNPISRQTITTITGLSKSAQRRLEVAAHVNRVPQYAVHSFEVPAMIDGKVVEISGPHGIGREILKRQTTVPVKVEVYGKNKVYLVNKRLPNVYQSEQQAAAKGILSKLSKRLKVLIQREARKPIRRYYKSEKRLAKGLNATGQTEGYFKLPIWKRLVWGRQEWESVVCI
ncbi:MAG: hypothetical protein HYX83_02290 [Chloroflexi bacterium]|nr:hypothetical protein [Chloroflexota bacterium]